MGINHTEGDGPEDAGFQRALADDVREVELLFSHAKFTDAVLEKENDPDDAHHDLELRIVMEECRRSHYTQHDDGEIAQEANKRHREVVVPAHARLEDEEVLGAEGHDETGL